MSCSTVRAAPIESSVTTRTWDALQKKGLVVGESLSPLGSRFALIKPAGKLADDLNERIPEPPPWSSKGD